MCPGELGLYNSALKIALNSIWTILYVFIIHVCHIYPSHFSFIPLSPISSGNTLLPRKSLSYFPI